MTPRNEVPPLLLKESEDVFSSQPVKSFPTSDWCLSRTIKTYPSSHIQCSNEENLEWKPSARDGPPAAQHLLPPGWHRLSVEGTFSRAPLNSVLEHPGFFESL
ncbi:hypothetical protein Y1Q_0015033 [Alligator mississippiensis]|uniref:Uncharacterized protein n=1 Tax=Alligator mississippiensis TaxID=8496 RepID=A0A151N925_ALLMI|nr:hypothetical protein Y1Q_0015033 [Alligator mississippiensis]